MRKSYQTDAGKKEQASDRNTSSRPTISQPSNDGSIRAIEKMVPAKQFQGTSSRRLSAADSPVKTSPHRQIRLIIVADVRLYREGLAQLLSCHDALKVVGAAPAAECLELVTVECPDIVLIEAAVVRKSEMLRNIMEVAPDVKCIAYGIVNEEPEAIECAEGGAAGYVSHEATAEDLVATVQSVAREEFSCSPRITALLLKRLSTVAIKHQDQRSEVLLTIREKQVLALVEEGLSNKEIGARLGIELATVKNHIHHLLEKLHATRRGEAVARVRREFLSFPAQRQLSR